MADLVSWIGDLFAMQFATIGTVDITLGLIVAYGLVTTLVLSVYKRTRSR